MKFLIPVDGSADALRAVEYVIQHVADWQQTPQIVLLNVQWNMATANVKLFISQDTLNEHYREQGLNELVNVRVALDAAQLAYEYHIRVGTPAETIVQYAREQNASQIVMSKQSDSGLESWLLGSVVNKVLHLANCPVMVI